MNVPNKMQFSHQSSQSGFTIIESLMAILVVTILMVGLAPVFALSVATRVQAKRVEKATHAANTYIDAVKSGSIGSPPITGANLSDYPVPQKNSLDCPANGYCTPKDLYCIDGDGDGKCKAGNVNDLFVQAFGQIPIDASGQAVDAAKGYRSYRLGVRVYRADAFNSKFTASFTKGTTQSAATGGIGLSFAQAPVVEMSTEIVVTDATKFKDLCDGANPKVNGC